MKKATMNENNNGVSKILIVVVIAVVLIAVAGAGLYLLGKSNSAEIDFKVEGVVVNDSDILIYINDDEISKQDVKGQQKFTLTVTALYGISKDETKDITVSSKVMEKNGTVVQTVSKVITVKGNEKYHVDLVFPYTTVESEITVELTSDATVTVSAGGAVLGTHEVVANEREVFEDRMMLTIPEGSTAISAKVTVKFSDGSTKEIEKAVNVVIGGTTEITFLVNNSTLV